MLRYHNFATWFAPFLRGLHVVTMEAERPADRPHYFRAEDQVLADRLPLDLLLEDGSVTQAVGQTSSPFVLLLDRHRQVRSEGELDGVDLWNAVASMPAGEA
jgi:hypothetical protein